MDAIFSPRLKNMGKPDLIIRNKSKRQRDAVAKSWRNPERREKHILGMHKAILRKGNWMIGKIHHWKGDKVSYRGLHDWINIKWGKAITCAIHGDKFPAKRCEWANITGIYDRDKKNWLNLCGSCHWRFDHGRLKLNTYNSQIL